MRLLLSIVLLGTLSMASTAMAALTVSNWAATATSLVFDITGTIDASATVGPVQRDTLFIGPAALPYQTGKKETTDTPCSSLGGTPTAIGRAILWNETGEYSAIKLQILKPNSEIWAAGDTLNYRCSLTDAGLPDLTGISVLGAIVSAGRDDPVDPNYINSPQAAYKVGEFDSDGDGVVDSVDAYPTDASRSAGEVPTLPLFGLLALLGLLGLFGLRKLRQ